MNRGKNELLKTAISGLDRADFRAELIVTVIAVAWIIRLVMLG